MAKRLKKTVSIVLVTSLAASLLGGCDLPLGKANKQQEVLERYLNACLEFDYRSIASCIDGKDDAFQDLELDSPQREIVELVLSKAEFEVVKVENDRARVSFTAPSLDKALRNENVAALELEDLEDILDDTDKIVEEEFEFDFVKDDKEWLIDPESTEDFAEFVGEIGLETAPKLGLGTRALEYFDTYITYLQQGNYMAALTMTNDGLYSMTGVSFNPEIDDILSQFYMDVFDRVFYEAEVVSCGDSFVTLEITGTRADLGRAIVDVSANNAELSVPFLKSAILYYIAFENADYSDYDQFEALIYSFLGTEVEFYSDCIDYAGTESFTFELELEIGSDGSLTFVDEPMNDIVGDINDTDFSDEFLHQALDELLASGEITQEQYNDLYGYGAEELLLFF